MIYPLLLPSQLSSHLRALRKSQGLTQTQLGAKLGLSQTRIARIESEPLSVSVEQLLHVLSILGVRLNLELRSKTENTELEQDGATTSPVGPEGDW